MSKKSFHHLYISPLLILGLACQTVTQVFQPPATLSPTSAPPITTSTAEDILGTPAPTVETFNLSLDEQLGIFEELWSIVNEEYLYADFNGLDWDAVQVEYRGLIEEGFSDQAFYQAMNEMVFRLGDDHSSFLTPEQVAEEEAEFAGDFSYVGIGIYAAPVPDRNRAVIILTFPGSPAEAAGLKSRDSILAVDGAPALHADGYIVENIRGPEGTTVTITAQTPGEEPRELVITRAPISSALPVLYELIEAPNGQRIGYILIPTFSDGTVGQSVGDALEALTAGGPLDGLIIDNRLNDGGFDTTLRDTLTYFVDGTAGYFVNRDGQEPLQIRGEDINGSLDVPLVVLVGPETYSFGEVFAGVLKDLGRAYIIGETTDGNVETLWGYDFDDGSRAWIAHDTFRPFTNPNDIWEETGIIPHLSIPVNWDEHTLATDPAVLAALEYFAGQ